MRRRILQCLGALGLLTLVGCGGGVRLVPVSGQVAVGDKAVTSGRVIFVPDSSRGNTAQVACAGQINAEGKYELSTTLLPSGSAAGKGAPLGWYKVKLADLKGKKKTDLEETVDPRFFNLATTPLSIEVVANPQPDAYAVKVTGPPG